jgi:hypothetical protein
MIPRTRAFIAACLFALGILGLWSEPQASAGDKPAPPKGQRIAWAGHSFLMFVPPIVLNSATGAGIKDQSYPALSGIGGSRVIQHWDVPEEKNKIKAALRDGKVDVLVLSPIWLPDDGIENFVKLAVTHNPKVRVHIQETWMPFDRPPKDIRKDQPKKVERAARTVDELRDMHADYFQSMDEHVRGLRKKHGETSVFVVPAGQAVIALRARIIAGKAPGLKTQDDLFGDAIGHARPPLQALVAYCHYAVIYRTSPVGLPVPKVLSTAPDAEALNRLLQELAWDAVRQHPLSGVGTR